MSKDKKPVVAAQGAATTPAVTPEPTPAVTPEPTPAVTPEPTPADAEKKADETATDVLAAIDALEGVETEANEVEADEWASAQATADEIFEQYEDKKEVFVTIDAQGFWVEDHAAAQNMKYRKFERK